MGAPRAGPQVPYPREQPFQSSKILRDDCIELSANSQKVEAVFVRRQLHRLEGCCGFRLVSGKRSDVGRRSFEPWRSDPLVWSDGRGRFRTMMGRIPGGRGRGRCIQHVVRHLHVDTCCLTSCPETPIALTPNRSLVRSVGSIRNLGVVMG